MREWHKWLYGKQAGLIGLSNLPDVGHMFRAH